MSYFGMTLFDLYGIAVLSDSREVFEHKAMYGDALIIKKSPELMRRRSPWESNLNKAEIEEIELSLKKFDTVDVAVPFLDGKGVIASGSKENLFVAKGLDPERARRLRGHKWEWDTVAGIPLHVDRTSGTIVIGTILSKLLGCEFKFYENEITSKGYIARARPMNCPHPTVTLKVGTANDSINQMEANIIGIVEGDFVPVDTSIIYTDIKFLQKLYKTESVSYFSIGLKNHQERRKFITDFNRALPGAPYEAIEWEAFYENKFFVNGITTQRIFIRYFLAVMLSTAFFSIFYAFVKLLAARSREIQTLLAIGFDRRKLTLTFVFEAMTLATFSCLISACCVVAAGYLLNSLEIPHEVGITKQTFPFRIAFHPDIFLSFLLVCALIATSGGYVAAYLHLKKNTNKRSV